MLNNNRNKKVGFCMVFVSTCLFLVALWIALAIPETTFAAKPGGGGEALNGSATFRDVLVIINPDTGEVTEIPDAVQSDGGGPYYDSGNGRRGDTVLDLGDAFFRLVAKKNLKKDTGRWFNLSFPTQVSPTKTSTDLIDLESAYFPEDPYVWSLHIQGTLQDWRAQDIGVPVLRDGDIYFGDNGKEEGHINYGTGSSWDGDQLTVTRIGEDVWTIESFATDMAQLWKAGQSFGYTPMPFKIDYDGTATAP